MHRSLTDAALLVLRAAASPRGGAVQSAEALRVLGLEPGCGPDEVRRAYRRVARRTHPDTAGERGRDGATDFLRAGAAFEHLSTPAVQDRLGALARLCVEARSLGLPRLDLAAGASWCVDVALAGLLFPVALVYELDEGALEAGILGPPRSSLPEAAGRAPAADAFEGVAPTPVATRASTLADALRDVSFACSRWAWRSRALVVPSPPAGVDRLRWAADVVSDVGPQLGLAHAPGVRARLDEGLAFLAAHLAAHGATDPALVRYVTAMFDDAVRVVEDADRAPDGRRVPRFA